MKSLLKIFFLSLIFLSPKISLAIGDTIPTDTATKYDLWDPRNPNCPCHQYQKLADEEYARLHGQKGNDNPIDTTGNYLVTNNDTTFQNKTFTSSSTNSSRHSSRTNSKLKQISKQIRKSKLFRIRKTSGKKWKKGHLIDCGRF